MKIYAPSHTLIADIDLQQGAIVRHELGGEHYVRLPFTLPTAVTFPIGSYADIPGFGRFEVTEENQPKFNAQTGGYDYDLQLDASYMKWKNKLLRYRPLNAKGSETSFRLTATIGTHLNVVTDNLRRLGEADPSFLYDGKEAYVSALKGVEDDAKNRHAFIAYEGTDILSALNRIAEAFGCEWWVEDNVIYMGRCELATDPVTLEMHDAIEQMSTQGSKGTYANRLIVFGSERNLPANYREATSPDIVTDGVVQRRLMLPEKDAPKGYIEAPGVTEKNAVEAVVVMEDIYPKVECIVGTLTSYVSETYDKEGNKVAETFYRVTDTAFKFTKEMILPDKKLHIVFQSGRMNGMDFEAEYSQKNNWFEIVANDTYGRKLPDKDLHPAQGDKFILYNWDSSKAADTGIIEKAEEKLLEAARKQLDKMQKDGTNYECTLTSYWAEKTFRTSAGEYTHYAVGQPVTIKDEARFPQGRKSRIIGYELKLDIPYDTPRYIIGESPFQSRTERLQQQIDSLTVGGKTYQGSGGSSSGGGQYIYLITQTSQVAPSDTNVFSAARTELDFVHKKKADTIEAGHTFAARQQFQQGADFGSSVTVDGTLLTRGKSTLSGGAQFGSTFVSGIAGGKGGQIDASGNAELDSLTLRHFLEVPELRYNRVTVMAGVQWRGAGGGIVKTVFPSNTPNGLLLLKLEKGEIPAVQVGDLCMGIFHSTNEADNETTDADSGTGRFQMKGFGTVYFEITGTVEGNVFKYTLRPTSAQWTKQLHPKAGMHFAVYGNRTVPERQDSRYSTLQYERFLKGVNDWEFGERNIMAQFGDLSNLTIGGKPMAGYSAYINNLYMSGVIDQFERLDPKLDITSSTGTYIGANERSELLIRLKDGYGTNASADVTHWAVERETGNTTADREWNTLHPNLPYDPSAAGAALSLTSADLGGNDSAVFRFSATYKDKAVTDILVLRRAAKDGQDGADGKDGVPGAPGKDGLNGQNGADGHGVAFSWSKNDYYTEAQLNEWLAVGADADPWYADTAGITIPAKARVGDYISASFRAKDTKNVHTVFGELTEINRANGSFRFRSLAHSVIPKGEQGIPGIDGINGVDGKPGKDGRTTYFHIKYSANANGTPMSETPNTYIGTYVDFTEKDSTDPNAYTWHRFEGLQGADGKQGIPGQNGVNGKTTYLHIKYSNDGKTFTDNAGETVGDYIGTLTDFTKEDSMTFADYTWKRIKGETGDRGPQGSNGLNGKNGTSQYLHIKYSANANGNPMTDSVDKYIGTVVTTSPTPPTAYTSYKWSQFKGDNGSNGLNGSDGTPGEDGETYQLHMAYANSEDGKVDFHTADPTMRAYVGTAVTAKSANPNNQDPTDPKAYTWKRVAPVSYTFLRYSNDGGETFTDIDRNNPAYKEEAAKWEGVNLVNEVPAGYKNGWTPWATLENRVNNCVHQFSMRAKELKKSQELVVSYVLEFNNVQITKGHGEDGGGRMQSYGSETGFTGQIDSCMYPSADWAESDFRKFFGLNTETPLNGTFLIQHRRPCSVNSKDERWLSNIRFDYCTGLVRIGRIMCCVAPSTDSYHPAPEIAYRGTQTGRYLGTLTWDKPFPSEDPKDYEWQDTQGFGEAFSWSTNDHYTEAQLNEWLAVDGTTPRYFSTNVPIGDYPNTRIGDCVSASFRAKDTKNVHTMKGRICDFQLDGGGVPYGIGFIVLSHSVVQKGEPGQDGQDGALGHGVAFSWSKDDHYTEAQLNEFLAVGHQESWSASVAGVKIPAEARVGDFVFASFRAKDLKNVHTYYARLTVIMPNRVDFAAVSLAHSVIPKGETGAQGVEGAIYRKTEWKVGVIHNDGSRVEADGHRYVDIVIRRTPNPAGGTLIGHFLCISYGESSIQDDPANYDKEEEVEVRRKWRKLNETVPTYTPLLLADNASIDFLQGNTIKVTERVGGVDKVVATLGNGEYPLYVGADSHGNAPFRVKRDGQMDSTSGTIGGWSITPKAIASANGSSVLDAVTGNIACSGMVIRRPVHITDDNADSYFTNVEGTKRYLNLFKSGTLIILGTRYKTPGNITVAGQSTYHLRFPGTVNNTEIGDAFLEASQYLGVTVFLFNLSSSTSYNGAIRIEGRLRKKGTTENRGWITLNPKASIKLTCVNDALNIVWEYEITDNTFTNIPTINLPDRIPGSPVAPERVQ